MKRTGSGDGIPSGSIHVTAYQQSLTSKRHRVIGYFVPEWPSQTHAFFWRELTELRTLFDEVHVISTKRPAPGASKHAFSAMEANRTHYLFPLRSGAILGQLGYMVRALRPLARYISETRGGAVAKARLAAFALCALDLARFASRNGITHVHGHSCANSAHILAMASRLGAFSYSLTLHGDLDVYGTEHRAKMSGAKFVSAVTHPLCKQIRSVIPSENLATPVITMGVDTGRFAPAVSKSGRRPVVITTVARLNVAKGHVFALEALRRVRDAGEDVRYVIAGSGPFESDIRAKVSELRLENHVDILGSLGELEVLDLLQSVDMFILPSVGLGEAAPVSVMEAMSCALPCIVSRIGGTEDMITDGADGVLVEQGDVNGIANAIAMLSRDEALRRKIGREARRRAVSSFDYRALAAKLAEEIER